MLGLDARIRTSDFQPEVDLSWKSCQAWRDFLFLLEKAPYNSANSGPQVLRYIVLEFFKVLSLVPLVIILVLIAEFTFIEYFPCAK